MQQASSSRILAIVAFIVFIDMMGVGLLLPVMPSLIMDISGAEISAAAETGGYLIFAYAGMQFLFSPLIGALSDRFGRRPILLATLFALGLNYVLMALSPTISWLFAARILTGIMGASWAAAYSCVSDCTTAERRGGAFGLLAAAGSAGYVIGPALGGFAGEFGPRVPCVIAACLSLGGAAAGWFLLQETLPAEKRRAFSAVRANPVGSLIQMSRSPFILACLAVIFFMQLSTMAQLSIWAFWGELQFGWTPMMKGLTVSVYGAMLGLVQAVLTGRCIKRFGPAVTARFSLMFGPPSYIFLALASSEPFLVTGMVLGVLTGMTFPALQGMMSARVTPDAQGELQGAIASTLSLTAIIGPIMMTQIFSQFADKHGVYFPGAPFVLSTLLVLIALTILWRTLSTA